MKALVVYYSLEGNTKSVASRIAERLGCDTLELVPEKEYPTDGKKYIWGGKAVVFKNQPKLKPYKVSLNDYDTIILGTPVWASSFAPPIRTFVNDNLADLVGKRLAFFACQAGNGAEKCFASLSKILSASPVATLVLIDPLKQTSTVQENEE